MPSPVRERSRSILHAELAVAATAYVAEHGFEETTVDEIAKGIGISRATFFRYFASKEDAVVTAGQGRAGALADYLDSAPAPADGSAWTLLRLAAGASVEHATRNARDERARVRMIELAPSLKARLAWVRRVEQYSVAESLERLVGDERTANALAAAAMSAIDLAWRDWTRDDDADFGELLDTWFAALAAVGSAGLDPDRGSVG